MVDDREDQSDSTEKEYPQKSTLLGDNGKLWIKLKISPSDDEHDEEDFAKDQKQPKGNNFPRICHVCSKGFRSGKALGGHMRIHFQTNKDLIFSKKQIKPSQPIFKLKKRKREAAGFAKKEDLNKSSNDGACAAGFNSNLIPTCSTCGKNFPSLKSLFGHMRCHPERPWRGIQPPPSAAVIKASPLSSVSEAELHPQKSDDAHQVDSAAAEGDQSVDLTKSLGGWSVTAKRGRRAIVDNSEEEEEEEDDDDDGMRDAVFHLMSLAQGDSCEAKLVNNKHKVEEFEATNSNSLTSKTENEDIMTKQVPGSRKGRKKESLAGFIKDHPVKELRNEDRKIDVFGNAKIVQETDFLGGKLANLARQWEENNSPKQYYGDKDCSDDESEDSENTLDQLPDHKNFETTNGNLRIDKNKKKRKRMKLKALDSVHDHAASPVQQVNPVVTMTTSPEKYRCTTCDKCFPTHQALGGHRSSHNKFRIVIQNSSDESTSAAGEDENLGNYSPTPVEKSNEGAASSHQCKICNRNFPTGQALGGHKRCHYSGQMEGLPNQVTSAGGVSYTGRRILEIDLNEVPPLEEEAGI